MNGIGHFHLKRSSQSKKRGIAQGTQSAGKPPAASYDRKKEKMRRQAGSRRKIGSEKGRDEGEKSGGQKEER